MESSVLHHLPYGLENPYNQEPYERSPRFPIAGEEVFIGIQTPHEAGMEAVDLHWTVQPGGKEGCVTADRTADDGKQVNWKAALPAFQGGETISYWIEGKAGGREVICGPFTFGVQSWVPLGPLVFSQAGKDFFFVRAVAAPGWLVEFSVRMDPAGNLHCTWQFQADPWERIHLPLDNPVEWSAVSQKLYLSSPFQLKICHADGQDLLAHSRPPEVLLDSAGVPQELRQFFRSADDEAFWGFGERFNSLNQRGQHLDICVYEQYKDQGLHTYMPVPFLISSQPYGLYWNTGCHLQFDLAAAQEDEWSVRAELDDFRSHQLIWLGDKSPGEILEAYVALTGKPVVPPNWAFGLWMSANRWNNQAGVLDQIQLAQQHQIPATVLVLEAWADESTFYIWNDACYPFKPADQVYRYGDFTFPREGRWPDPQELVRQIHAAGMKLLLWQIPVIKKKLEPELGPQPRHWADETYAIQKGYTVYRTDGSPYRILPAWFRDSILIDFSNPEAIDWWMARRAYLLEDLGVDGFKTDGGEHIWGKDLVFHDGRNREGWNRYPALYQGAYHRFVQSHKSGDAILFSRSGSAGSQTYPCHWAGDENSTWAAFRSSLLAMQNAGMSGIPFTGWDLAGFSGPLPSAELYLRATAAAVFCPIMQFHSEPPTLPGSINDRTPWNIQDTSGDPRVIDLFRRFANLRMNLLPYILDQACHTSNTGRPLMGPLFFEHPSDLHCRQYPFEYFFGQDLLVAPVIEPGQEQWEVYLPEGDWFDFWSGEPLSSGIHNVRAPLESIPVFVRSGAILPLNLGTSLQPGSQVSNRADAYQNLTFQIYGSALTKKYWFDAISQKTICIEANPTQYNLHAGGLIIPYRSVFFS